MSDKLEDQENVKNSSLTEQENVGSQSIQEQKKSKFNIQDEDAEVGWFDDDGEANMEEDFDEDDNYREM